MDQCVEVSEYVIDVIDVVGEGAVGIGTDFTQDQDVAFFEWLRHDKGHGRLLVPGTPRVHRQPERLVRGLLRRRRLPATRSEPLVDSGQLTLRE